MILSPVSEILLLLLISANSTRKLELAPPGSEDNLLMVDTNQDFLAPCDL